MIAPDVMTSLRSVRSGTEEAILNAMCMAETSPGERHAIHALPLDLLQEVMRRYRPSAGWR